MNNRIYSALSELRDRLPRLDDALIVGTPRRWNERDLTPAERDRQDAQALQDRAAKEWNARLGRTALGASRAPLSLSVLDASIAINAGVNAVERAACEWLGITPLLDATTHERITRILGLIVRIEALDELAAWVEDEAVRLNRHAGHAIGDVEPIHKIRARCPICDAMSLRALPEREQVVCVNALCRCTDETCACNAARSRRHCWPYAQWQWLAQVLDSDLQQSAS